MNVRHLLAAPVVAAAIAGPYLAKEEQATEDQGRSSSPTANALDGTVLADVSPPVSLNAAEIAGAGADSAAALAGPLRPAAPIPPFDASGARLVGPQVSDFSEVLRFDISPEWIFSRWSRVTTVTADQALQGFRAPLVTGAKVDDVAGVATYYFGRQGRLQRFTFTGHTGDTRRLVAFLIQNYGFRPEPSLGGGLYLVTWNAEPRSALRVDYAPLVRSDAPHLRYSIKLEINRPDEAYHMSESLRSILDTDQKTKRWARP